MHHVHPVLFEDRAVNHLRRMNLGEQPLIERTPARMRAPPLGRTTAPDSQHHQWVVVRRLEPIVGTPRYEEALVPVECCDLALPAEESRLTLQNDERMILFGVAMEVVLASAR